MQSEDMPNKCHLTYTLWLLVLCLNLSAQNDTNYRFENLPLEIGFPNVGVNDLLEDHQGFLWMATWSGLAKYDGYSVKMYRQQPDHSNGLKSNKITQLFEDSKGNLWVGTNYTGFYRYDRNKDVFIQYRHQADNMNSLSHDNVWAIFEDREGILWIGTEKGLNKFNPDTGHFIHYEHNPADSRSLSHNFVYSITQAEDGSIWIGTEEGLNRLMKYGDEVFFIHYNLAPENITHDVFLAHNFIYKIIPSNHHPSSFWICTSMGLKKVKFSPEDPSFFDYQNFGHHPGKRNSLSHPFVSDVYEKSASQIWVATFEGLNLLDMEKDRCLKFISNKNIPYSLNNNLVRCLFTDRTNNLWIGTDKGVSKLDLNPSAFQNIQLNTRDFSNTNVTSILSAFSKNGLWVSSKGGGLSFFPTDQHGNLLGPAQHYQIEVKKMQGLASFFSDLLMDRDGSLWMATQGAGVLKIKENNIPGQGGILYPDYQFTKSDQLTDDYVMSLFESSSGDVWLGYWDKGIDRYDPHTDTFHHYLLTMDMSINFQDFPVVHIIETIEKGISYLWVGTRGGGIYKLFFDKKNNGLSLVKRYRSENNNPGSLSNNFINAFHIDQKKQLWIGTDSGLNVLDYEKGTFTSYFERDGLMNGIIQSILEDKLGNIWVSTQRGISCLNFSNGSLTVKNFDAYDGLQDNYFNDEAAIQTKAGHLVFGGVNGLTIFKPEVIQRDRIVPKIKLTGFRLFNQPIEIDAKKNGRTILSKSISETRDLELSYRENVISFEFTGLHFGEPKKLKYAYQLEGFDPDWVYTDASQRMAHYTNLPYDKFTFKVKAANGDGLWSEPAQLNLRINPPFWLTNWAYAIYACLIIGIIYVGWRITMLRAAFQHSLELERVEREKLEEVNKLKLQFFTNISHELRTPLTLIISPLEQLLQAPRDRSAHTLFTRMHFNANRLLNMINQLLDIRKSEVGLMKLHVKEGDVVEFGKEITASFKNLAKQRNINLGFSSDKNEIPLWFDHDQLEKVFFNLLSNAFKFTKDRGNVEVRISQTDSIHIEISDTGIGIPEKDLDNIFERFYQVENSPEWARKSGTGIGLALTKTIIEKHHGSIEVDSQEGIGSSFMITLRPGKDHFTKEEIISPDKNQQEISSFILNSTPEELTELPEPASSKSLLPNQHRPSVLLVEDNAEIRSYLRETLEKEYTISEASDGLEGLEKALSNPPELIIADIAMPRMDGIELCAKVKSNFDTSHVPIILLTARTSLVFKIDGLETGADDYVTKPFHIRLLKARIKNLIESRKALRERFAQSFDFSPSALVMNSIDEKLLSQIKKVVEEHLDDSQFSVDQLAGALNLSRMQLYRKLKSLTGKSPNQVIRTFRLKRAAQLLETGQFNVSDVTYMVGYNDLKSFREQFKKEFGVNPSGYHT